jgi:D-inositol-3-phosphate glycosyltransferase
MELILRAFSLVASQTTEAFLAIAGEGEDRDELEVLVRDLGLVQRVFFLGRVPHLPDPNLPRLFNCADVCVVGSFHESLALVITEALACGTPVVSTRVGIAPKVIHDGVTGYLLQSRHPDEMASRLGDLLCSGTVDRKECVAVAKEYAETSKGICDVIERLCERHISCTASSHASGLARQLS